MNDITLPGEPNGAMNIKEPRGMKSLLDGKINFKSKFNKNDQKGNFKTIQPFETRHHITGQGCIGMADMRFIIHIVNRCGDVIGLAHKFYPDKDELKF